MERAELIQLLESTGCAERFRGYAFLCDPAWSAVERSKVTLLQRSATDESDAEVSDGWVCIPTGGSSGGVQFARHDERTLSAAVRGFCAHFGLDRVNALGVLPPHHVSGLMARVRCAATGGQYLAWDWKHLERGDRPPLDLRQEDWVLSLVPTQLQRLLASPEAAAWLRDFRVIFIGGGPVWPELANAAARAELPISLSYGLTETAAMVAALRPSEFLTGDRSSGSALPHARISIDHEGTIKVAGESVFRGYFPETSAARELVTEDVGLLDELGHLHVLGRRDAVIITGGKKVQPTEVEGALRASGEFADVAVVGVPDAEWGQVVVAGYAAGGRKPDLSRMPAALQALAAFKRPKHFVAIEEWPRNAQGKINRVALLAVICRQLGV